MKKINKQRSLYVSFCQLSCLPAANKSPGLPPLWNGGLWHLWKCPAITCEINTSTKSQVPPPNLKYHLFFVFWCYCIWICTVKCHNNTESFQTRLVVCLKGFWKRSTPHPPHTWKRSTPQVWFLDKQWEKIIKQHSLYVSLCQQSCLPAAN